MEEIQNSAEEQQNISNDSNETQPIINSDISSSLTTIAADDIEADATNQSMEAHHPHHPIHYKKKWKEYLSEFLMIFLAVFLGFLAENFREHLSDREKEKEYIHSLVADLESDVANFKINSVLASKKINEIDTLINLLHSSNRNHYTNQIYFLARAVTINAGSYTPNTRTFEQLKNSGGLRLIHQSAVADSITDYYQAIKWIESENDFTAAFTEKYIEDDHLLFDNFIYQQMIAKNKSELVSIPADHPKLLSDDPAVANQITARLHRLYSLKIIITNRINSKYIPKASRLIALLQKEYNL